MHKPAIRVAKLIMVDVKYKYIVLGHIKCTYYIKSTIWQEKPQDIKFISKPQQSHETALKNETLSVVSPLEGTSSNTAASLIKWEMSHLQTDHPKRVQHGGKSRQIEWVNEAFCHYLCSIADALLKSNLLIGSCWSLRDAAHFRQRRSQTDSQRTTLTHTG